MARPSSRKYHNVDRLDEVRLVFIGTEPRPGKSNLMTTVAFHPEGAVLVRAEKGRTEFMVSCGGVWHRQIRPCSFDDAHLKRVVGTVMRDVLDFDEVQRNLIMSQRPKSRKRKTKERT